MTAPRPSITGDPGTPEPDDTLTAAEPVMHWVDPEELDHEERPFRDGRPLGDYFERMRERGLLD